MHFVHFQCGYDVKVQWTYISVCNHRYTKLIDTCQTVLKHTRTHTRTNTYRRKCEWEDMLELPGTKSDYNLSTEQTEDEQKKPCCNGNLESAFCVLMSTKNTSFTHNLYQAIISIFMHKRFLPRRLYHNPLERHRFFSFHCVYIVVRFENLSIFFGVVVVGKCIRKSGFKAINQQFVSSIHFTWPDATHRLQKLYVCDVFPYRQKDGATKKKPNSIRTFSIFGSECRKSVFCSHAIFRWWFSYV